MSYIERRLGEGGYPNSALPSDRPAQATAPRSQPAAGRAVPSFADMRTAEIARQAQGSKQRPVHAPAIRELEHAIAGNEKAISDLKELIRETSSRLASRVDIVFLTGSATAASKIAADKAVAALNFGRAPQVTLDARALPTPEDLPRSLSVPRHERLFVRIENGEKLDRETFGALCERLLGIGAEGATVMLTFARSRYDMDLRLEAVEDIDCRRPGQIGSRTITF